MVLVREREYSLAASPENLKFVNLQPGNSAELDCSASAMDPAFTPISLVKSIGADDNRSI
jgi:hypothetical protein